MLKIINNLISINKLVLFQNNLIDEDIDIDLFSSQIKFNLNFTILMLDSFWDEYTKFVDVYEKENFVKTYYFTLKRLHKFLYKLKDNNSFLNKAKLEESEVKEIIIKIQNRINLIRENKFNIKYADTKKQCINEEEYFILFNKNDD